jgi:hypothetical protein
MKELMKKDPNMRELLVELMRDHGWTIATGAKDGGPQSEGRFAFNDYLDLLKRQNDRSILLDVKASQWSPGTADPDNKYTEKTYPYVHDEWGVNLKTKVIFVDAWKNSKAADFLIAALQKVLALEKQENESADPEAWLNQAELKVGSLRTQFDPSKTVSEASTEIPNEVQGVAIQVATDVGTTLVGPGKLLALIKRGYSFVRRGGKVFAVNAELLS